MYSEQSDNSVSSSIMAYTDNISRLSRLTGILLKLQTRAYISVPKLAEEFGVSKRTIYRDLTSLEQSGVPLVAMEGKGYALMDGYQLPPIRFTESEANALIMAEHLIATTKDESLITEFTKAIDKIKSVLEYEDKEKVALLSERTLIGTNWKNTRDSAYLTSIQKALTNYRLIQLSYLKAEATQVSDRIIEPFAIYHNPANQWVLIAWCRLRKDFRNFRLDRMQKVQVLEETFEPHTLSLEEYTEIQRKKYFEEYKKQ